MKYLVVSVRDIHTGFTSVVCESNRETAIRNFVVAVGRDRSSMLWTHPQDFDLYYIGDFDSETGDFSPAGSRAYPLIDASAAKRYFLDKEGKTDA